MTEPLNTLVAGQIWERSHDIQMLPGVLLPARMLVVRLAGRSLALWSPVPLDDDAVSAIRALGDVTTILAPNNYHHLYLRGAMERFSEAMVWVAPGLPAKRKDLRLTHTLGPGASPPWAADLKPLFLAGAPRMDETVLLHHATSTLIVTDAVFNITQVRGPLSRTMFRLMGSYGRPVQSRVWRSVVTDRAAMAASTRAVLAEDFDRLIMAHGDVIDAGARAVFRDAASWLPGLEAVA